MCKGACQPGGSDVNGNCFYLVTNTGGKKQTDAEQYCIATYTDGHLTSIHSQAEWDHIVNMIQNAGRSYVTNSAFLLIITFCSHSQIDKLSNNPFFLILRFLFILKNLLAQSSNGYLPSSKAVCRVAEINTFF